MSSNYPSSRNHEFDFERWLLAHLEPDGSVEQLAGMDIVNNFGYDTITTPERAPYVLAHLLNELDYRINGGLDSLRNQQSRRARMAM
ncbi:MAG: hypothetical protein CM15mV33_380 [uncultured marine virus]|nr:MAG: hypothetical protein CM15mV33_380 [uncultured marine virus]